jgi:hypothetical protein
MSTLEPVSPWENALTLWEWRTFEPLEASVRARVESLPQLTSHRLEDEYLLLPGRNDLNIKIRRRSFKVKRLLSEVGALQEWAHIEIPFPARGETVGHLLGQRRSTVDGGAAAYLDREELRDFVGRVCVPPAVSVVLDKKRRIFSLEVADGRVRIELAAFCFLGRRLVTLAIDARTKGQLGEAVRRLELENYSTDDYLGWLATRAPRRHSRTDSAWGFKKP